jgi:hypothetical protein
MKLKLVIPIMLLALMAQNPIQADSDRDYDGIPDSRDNCPDSMQIATVSPDFRYIPTLNPERLEQTPKSWPVNSNGCELDSDRDGIINSQDYCPDNTTEELSYGVANNGCPMQSDSDGTPDYRDHCPNTPPNIATNQFGCPK